MARLLAVNWRDLKNPDAGGAEVHLQEILTRLAAGGHDVTLFATRFRGAADTETYDGVRVIRRGNWYDANFVLARHVKSYLARHDVDLVIEDINKIPFYLPVWLKRPVVAVVPHLFGATVFRETNPVFASYVYLWERMIPWVYKRSRFVVISPSTRSDLIARGIPGERIEVVLCGLDHGTYRRLDDLQRYDVPTIIHFGRVRKYKCIDVVIRAFSRIRAELGDARLLIVGDGPERANLARLAEKLGLEESVSFLGMVETSELVRILNRAHLFLNASPKEGWGLTVVEANACGLPVVASRRPGLQDSVRDGETGFLVEFGNEREFAARSLELLRDPEKWARMSAAALTWARSLTWEHTADEMERIFAGEIARSRGGVR